MPKETQKEPKKEGCPCGDDRVMLTEERNSPRRCAGCGKPLRGP